MTRVAHGREELLELLDLRSLDQVTGAEDFEHELFFGGSEPYDADRDER